MGSTVLIDVDDVFPTDDVGVNFAQIICGTININESLMNNNLAKMYDYSCTESEFMYAVWAMHNCNEPEIIIPAITSKNNLSPNTINNTISQNNTTLIEEIIENNQNQNSYLVGVVIVILICLVLYFYVKKNQNIQNKSFTNIEFLE